MSGRHDRQRPVRAGPPGILAAHVGGKATGHAVKPAGHRLLFPDRVRLDNQQQERGLEDVLRIPRIREQPPTEAQDHRTVPLHQGLKGGLIPLAAEALQQFAVVQVGSGMVRENSANVAQKTVSLVSHAMHSLVIVSPGECNGSRKS